MSRLSRAFALLVLVTSIIQIGGCVAGCDCFGLPNGPTASVHSSGPDADGCLCCGQYLGFRVAPEMPVSFVAEFLPASLPPTALGQNQTGVDHPPRS